MANLTGVWKGRIRQPRQVNHLEAFMSTLSSRPPPAVVPGRYRRAVAMLAPIFAPWRGGKRPPRWPVVVGRLLSGRILPGSFAGGAADRRSRQSTPSDSSIIHVGDSRLCFTPAQRQDLSDAFSFAPKSPPRTSPLPAPGERGYGLSCLFSAAPIALAWRLILPRGMRLSTGLRTITLLRATEWHDF